MEAGFGQRVAKEFGQRVAKEFGQRVAKEFGQRVAKWPADLLWRREGPVMPPGIIKDLLRI